MKQHDGDQRLSVHGDALSVTALTRSRRGRIRAVLALGTVLSLGTLATMAAFSDEATVTATLTAGTLDITVDGEEGQPVPYALAISGSGAMVPGDTLHVPLEIANVGTVDADLAMSVEVEGDGSSPNATDDLRLVIAHTTGDDCDATVVTADASPYSADGPLAAAAFSGVELDGGDAIDLCLAITLPSSVTGTGGGSSDVELTFLAEQAA